MSNHSGELIIQCKSVDGGKVGKPDVRNEFKKHGDAENEGKHRAYVFTTNGKFTRPAKDFIDRLRDNGWAVEYKEEVEI